MYRSGSAQRVEPAAAPAADRPPILIVGNGPVGMRVAAELLARPRAQALLVYGDEQHEPYDRVRLSSWLAGETDWPKLAQPLRHPESHRVEQRLGYRVVAIDRAAQQVVDSTGASPPYSGLVLATGSRPFVPGIEGIEPDGVYTFRDLDDANRLLARRARSHHTVVVGGGLLGLEAARGMQRGNTQVTLIEHADRLLGQQIDEVASRHLEARVRALGSEVLVGEAVNEVLGRGRVEGLRLRSGLVVACDTLIAGAPIPMQRDDWRERLRQDPRVLYRHAIEGFFGPDDTFMPPRGGNERLGGERVRAAVDYMAALARSYIQQTEQTR